MRARLDLFAGGVLRTPTQKSFVAVNYTGSLGRLRFVKTGNNLECVSAQSFFRMRPRPSSVGDSFAAKIFPPKFWSGFQDAKMPPLSERSSATPNRRKFSLMSTKMFKVPPERQINQSIRLGRRNGLRHFRRG